LAELIRRGFILIRESHDLIVLDDSKVLPFVQRSYIRKYQGCGVMLDLHREGGCFCDYYHHEEGDFSRVGFDGVFTRPPPPPPVQ
jgi:hypothetical protein